MYPLVRELAAEGIPVVVACRILKLARQPYYRWLTHPIGDRELDQAHLASTLFDAHRDDPEQDQAPATHGHGPYVDDQRPRRTHDDQGEHCEPAHRVPVPEDVGGLGAGVAGTVVVDVGPPGVVGRSFRRGAHVAFHQRRVAASQWRASQAASRSIALANLPAGAGWAGVFCVISDCELPIRGGPGSPFGRSSSRRSYAGRDRRAA